MISLLTSPQSISSLCSIFEVSYTLELQRVIISLFYHLLPQLSPDLRIVIPSISRTSLQRIEFDNDNNDSFNNAHNNAIRTQKRKIAFREVSLIDYLFAIPGLVQIQSIFENHETNQISKQKPVEVIEGIEAKEELETILEIMTVEMKEEPEKEGKSEELKVEESKKPIALNEQPKEKILELNERTVGVEEATSPRLILDSVEARSMTEELNLHIIRDEEEGYEEDTEIEVPVAVVAVVEKEEEEGKEGHEEAIEEVVGEEALNVLKEESQAMKIKILRDTIKEERKLEDATEEPKEGLQEEETKKIDEKEEKKELCQDCELSQREDLHTSKEIGREENECWLEVAPKAETQKENSIELIKCREDVNENNVPMEPQHQIENERIKDTPSSNNLQLPQPDEFKLQSEFVSLFWNSVNSKELLYKEDEKNFKRFNVLETRIALNLKKERTIDFPSLYKSHNFDATNDTTCYTPSLSPRASVDTMRSDFPPSINSVNDDSTTPNNSISNSRSLSSFSRRSALDETLNLGHTGDLFLTTSTSASDFRQSLANIPRPKSFDVRRSLLNEFDHIHSKDGEHVFFEKQIEREIETKNDEKIANEAIPITTLEHEIPVIEETKEETENFSATIRESNQIMPPITELIEENEENFFFAPQVEVKNPFLLGDLSDTKNINNFVNNEEIKEESKEAIAHEMKETKKEFIIETRNLADELKEIEEEEEIHRKVEPKQSESSFSSAIKKDSSLDRIINGVKENFRTPEEEMKLKVRCIKQKKIVVSSSKLWKIENESIALSTDIVALLRFLNRSKNWNALIEEKIIKSLEEFDSINAETIDKNIISKGKC